MKILFLAGLLTATGLAAEADKDTIEFVEKVLKTPTENLPPSVVPKYLDIEMSTLPERLRAKAKAKRIELYTLKHLADTQKRGIVRIPDDNCDIPKDFRSDEARLLAFAGYGEFTADDVECIKKHTKCTERDLMCEFTLQILIEKDRKGRKKYRFFFHKNDPVTSAAGACRGGVGGQTNFFGRANFLCSR